MIGSRLTLLALTLGLVLTKGLVLRGTTLGPDYSRIQGFTVAYSSCLEYAVDYVGGDLTNQPNIKTPLDCQQECRKHPNCLYFTYVKEEFWNPAYRKKCFLRSERNVKNEETPGVISGPHCCPGNIFPNGTTNPSSCG
eukprot:maker-scaffold612_size124412-snap-gene-0.26 protein:Tk03313 transcript:maker-scaffold612_size124412-snap-gene-0.26-mRNA-1 annotation:"microneme protein mic17a"